MTQGPGFNLKLGNGQGWHIIGSGGSKPWAERLASIMQLERSESNGYPKLIFIEKESHRKEDQEPVCRLDKDIRDALPEHGWEPHGTHAFRLWTHRDATDVICEISEEGDQRFRLLRMRLFLYPVYQRAQESGGLPFHAALVERDRRGVLLAAPGRTGKSTCCRRLAAPWFALGDDETLIVRGPEGRYFVHPFPTWKDCLPQHSQRTWNVQSFLPLSAIFFLERGENDKVFPVGEGEAAISITKSAIQPWRRTWIDMDRGKEISLRRKLFDNACEIAKAVPAFKLRVSLNGQFWEEMEKVLK
jgi:SynChlorMet cassette protein ScmC